MNLVASIHSCTDKLYLLLVVIVIYVWPLKATDCSWRLIGVPARIQQSCQQYSCYPRPQTYFGRGRDRTRPRQTSASLVPRLPANCERWAASYQPSVRKLRKIGKNTLSYSWDRFTWAIPWVTHGMDLRRTHLESLIGANSVSAFDVNRCIYKHSGDLYLRDWFTSFARRTVPPILRLDCYEYH